MMRFAERLFSAPMNSLMRPSWITDQMKMVGHQHVSDEFAWPFQVEGVQFVQKGGAESRVCEDFSSIQNVASDKMQRAGKI